MVHLVELIKEGEGSAQPIMLALGEETCDQMVRIRVQLSRYQTVVSIELGEKGGGRNT